MLRWIVQYFTSELQINGELYQGKNAKHLRAYFGSIAVLYGNLEVIASRNSKTIELHGYRQTISKILEI